MYRINIDHKDVLIKMFRFSLEEQAQEWCRYLPGASGASLKYFHVEFHSLFQEIFSTEILYPECCEEFKLLYSHSSGKRVTAFSDSVNNVCKE